MSEPQGRGRGRGGEGGGGAFGPQGEAALSSPTCPSPQLAGPCCCPLLGLSTLWEHWGSRSPSQRPVQSPTPCAPEARLARPISRWPKQMSSFSSLLVVWALTLPPHLRVPVSCTERLGPGSGQGGGPRPRSHTPLFGAYVLVLRLLGVRVSILKLYISSFSS